MGEGNQTSWTEFVLVGLSDLPHLRAPFFVGFLLIYLATIGGNFLVMSVIYSDSHLQTPMYFFLTNLSFVDISYTSVLFPQMLANFFHKDPRITLWECLLQVYFFTALTVVEFSILTIMSFDRYIAICNPLHYTGIMSKPMCLHLATAAWIVGLIEPIFHIVELSKFSYCKSQNINHFFCEYTALLKLSCSSTLTFEKMGFLLAAVFIILSCLLIVASYIKIISAILKIQTTTQKHKAFSTCLSHLTAVILFYGVLMFIYLRPVSAYSPRQSKIFFLVYSGAIPMSNPIIYTIKNKEFKQALHRKTGTNF